MQTCPHGNRVLKGGISQRNRPYVGWYCATGERDCSPEWVPFEDVIAEYVKAHQDNTPPF
jgi:hypothetical protein